MNITDKIEEIRRAPEYIRLRWVWGLTASCMLVVILLWMILIKSQASSFSQGLGSGNSNLSAEFDQQKKSIKDATGQIKSTLDKATQQGASSATNESANNPTDSGEGFVPNVNQ